MSLRRIVKPERKYGRAKPYISITNISPKTNSRPSYRNYPTSSVSASTPQVTLPNSAVATLFQACRVPSFATELNHVEDLGPSPPIPPWPAMYFVTNLRGRLPFQKPVVTSRSLCQVLHSSPTTIIIQKVTSNPTPFYASTLFKLGTDV
ncbi:hypothetical protein D9757_009832 [Collybiopsis confluens]|uniref:Uncharacterized protein n=1 Tax=Collybiopsis confluens TaxID=2823264 RepID=A0A8H5H782_9AGAR|nr:hypothetical protein D9757_009832 [Collybiopsis confluens]